MDTIFVSDTGPRRDKRSLLCAMLLGAFLLGGFSSGVYGAQVTEKKSKQETNPAGQKGVEPAKSSSQGTKGTKGKSGGKGDGTKELWPSGTPKPKMEGPPEKGDTAGAIRG